MAVAVVGLLGRAAQADRRSFTQTYEFVTVPEGKTALEMWHTESRDTWDKDTTTRLTQILEVEHGLTDRWDAAVYFVLKQVASSDPTVAENLKFDSVKVETRYKLADRGELPIDTLVYLEASKDFGASVYEIEGKVIAARDFGALTLAANAIGEIVVGNDVAETEFVVGWAAGATVEPHPKLRIGVESWGVYESKELAVSAGPAINIAPSGNFWVTFTAGFGVSAAADAFTGAAILGIEL